MDKVLNFLNNLSINKKENVIIACSGGPDSMFLMCLLNELGYKVICAHVNHKMRKSSESEYIFLKEFCEKRGIIFEGIEILSYDKKMNFHEYAREFRYRFFEEMLKKYDSKYLFTAHHGDDLTETILMRLVRGSSLKGYAGFNKITRKDGYDIIRPLVFLTKDWIFNYCKENDIPYVVDESNLEDHYTRNRYRHNILPFLKSEDESVHLKMLDFSETIHECSNYINNIVIKFLNDNYVDNILNIDEFNKLETFIKKQVLMKILSHLYPNNLYLVSKVHIEEILKLIENEAPNLKYNLPGDIRVKKEYNKLYFNYADEESNFKLEFNEELCIENFYFKKIENTNNNSNDIIKLNLKDIKLPLYFRNRLEGDIIDAKNLDGTTKVKKVMIDKKIPLSLRNKYPILVDDNDEILWIPGLKKSKKDVSNEKYCDIIIKYEKKEEKNEK